MSTFILALDQGTTSSRAIVFDRDGRARVVGAAGVPADLSRRPGMSSTIPRRSGRRSWRPRGRRSRKAGIAPHEIAAIGVTNQRETTVALGRRPPASPSPTRSSGRAASRAPICEALKAAGPRGAVSREDRARRSMRISPARRSSTCSTPFAGLRARAERGEVLFGTVDSFLIWRLTGGRVHVTDVSNASRTLLFNIHTLDVGRRAAASCSTCRARCCPRCDRRARSTAKPTRRFSAPPIPIAGVAGDQQAALVRPGVLRAGRGEEHLRHRLLHAAQHRREPVPSQNGLLTTVGWTDRRQDDVLPRRVGVHRRRGGAVAARRPEGDQRVGRTSSGCAASVADTGRRLPGAGVRRPRRAVLGSVRARR